MIIIIYNHHDNAIYLKLILQYNGSEYMAVRFVAVFEEVSTSTATFPLTTKAINNSTQVMVITIKGNFQTKECPHSEWPNFTILQEIYSSLSQTLTNYHIDAK